MDIATALVSLLSTAFYAFVVAFVVGAIIFVHELGHFLACKKVGVRVQAFSLGFGPVLFGYKRGDTEYRLSLIPIGGYVKMAGENVGDVKAGKPDEFPSRTVGERTFIVIAGVATHIAFAFLIFIVAFRIGVPFPAAEVGDVLRGSPAWVEGLEPGDEIIEINGNRNVDYEELVCASALGNGRDVSLRIRRGQGEFCVSMAPEYDEESGTCRIGIQPQCTNEVEKIYAYKEDKEPPPAIKADIHVGDVIACVNDVETPTWQELSREIHGRPGETVRLTIRRGRETIKKEVHIESICRRKIIGIVGATTTIKAVRKRTPAYDKARFRENDRVVAVDRVPVQSWTQFSSRMAAEEPVSTVTVDRAGKEAVLSLEGLDRKARVEMVADDILPLYGTTVTKVAPGSAAEAAGIKEGDTIVSIDGQPMENWDDIFRTVLASDGQEMKMVVVRDGEPLPPITLAGRDDPESRIGYIGIMPAQKTVVKKYGLWESCVVGCRKAAVNVRRVYMTLTGLVTKKVAFKNVGGIILIVQASYYSALEGVGKLLYFVGVIAINLAVVNLLPIPLLDGGLLLFLAIEKIKGAPVSEGALRIAQYVGLAVLLTLMVFVFRNDIVRLWQMYHS